MKDKKNLDEADKKGLWTIDEFRGVKRGEVFYRDEEKFVVGGYHVICKAFNTYPVEHCRNSKSGTIHMMLGAKDIREFQKIEKDKNEK